MRAEGRRGPRGLFDEKGFVEAGLSGRETTLNEDAFVAAFLELDVAGGVEFCDDVVARVRHEEFHGIEGIGDLLEAGGDELIEIFAGAGGDEQGVGRDEVGAVEGGFVGGVDFVEDGDDGFFNGPEFFEDGEGRLVVLGGVGVGDVEHVDQKIGENNFLEGGFEGFDEAVRQAPDETDGVGDENYFVSRRSRLYLVCSLVIGRAQPAARVAMLFQKMSYRNRFTGLDVARKYMGEAVR